MEQLPKIARERLAQQRAGSEHPAADVLAGFIERSLREGERQRVLSHLARCADCRGVVALATPEVETTVVNVQPQQRAWYEWSLFRFGGLAAALTVIILAVVLFRPHGREAQEASAPAMPSTSETANSSSSNEKQPANPPETATRLEDKSLHRVQPVQRDNRTTSAGPAKQSSVASVPEQRGEKKSYLKGAPEGAAGTIDGKLSGVPTKNNPAATTGTGSTFEKKQPSGGVIGGAARAKAAAPVTPPVAAARTRSEQDEGVPQIQGQETQQSQTFDQVESNAVSTSAGSAPAPPAQRGQVHKDAAAAQAPAPANQAEVAPMAKAQRAPAETAQLRPGHTMPPSAGVPVTSTLRWTISAAGTVQSSRDNGAHWEDVAVAQGAKFRTLAVAGTSVWAGGSALYYSKDLGAHWERVSIAQAGHSLEGEITRIELPSGTRVEVMTSAGQKWISTDLGQTWHLQ
jgi:hypothetical protein